MISSMEICKVFALLVCISSCSGVKKEPSSSVNFADSDIILAHDLLDKIYSKELPPIECISDSEEASLYQRALGPVFERIQDEFEATLADEKKLQTLLNQCEKDCTCHYLS